MNIDFEAPVGYVEPQRQAQELAEPVKPNLPAPQKAVVNEEAEETPKFVPFAGGAQRIDGKNLKPAQAKAAEEVNAVVAGQSLAAAGREDGWGDGRRLESGTVQTAEVRVRDPCSPARPSLTPLDYSTRSIAQSLNRPRKPPNIYTVTPPNHPTTHPQLAHSPARSLIQERRAMEREKRLKALGMAGGGGGGGLSAAPPAAPSPARKPAAPKGATKWSKTNKIATFQGSGNKLS